jgi:hypothetical protein
MFRASRKAFGEARTHLGEYAQSLFSKYLLFAAAGSVFAVALVFVLLAVFWVLMSQTGSPVVSAGIMAVILAFAGLLIVVSARRKPKIARQAVRSSVYSLQSQIPSVDDVGRQIERAVDQFGPIRVAAAALGGGVLAGMLAKRRTPTAVRTPRLPRRRIAHARLDRVQHNHRGHRT